MNLLTTQSPTNIAGSEDVCLTTPGEISWNVLTHLSFDAHWLHESTGNRMAGVFGTQIDAGATAVLRVTLRLAGATRVDPDANGWLRVRWSAKTTGEASIPPHINVSVLRLDIPDRAAYHLGSALLGVPVEDRAFSGALESFAAWNSLPREIAQNLSRISGRVQTEDEWVAFRSQLRATRRFAAHLLDSLAPAVEKSISLSLVRVLENRKGAEFLDCSFAPTAAGQEIYARCSAGDVDCIAGASPQDVVVHRNDLAASDQTVVELHMPCSEKKRAFRRGTELQKASIHVEESGRVTVRPEDSEEVSDYQARLQVTAAVAAPVAWPEKLSNDKFGIGFEDVRPVSRRRLRPMLQPFLDSYGFSLSAAEVLRCLPPGDDSVQVSISLSLPGSAGEAWPQMPKERSVGHYNAMLEASVGVQAAFRFWIPYIHFADPDSYADLDTAWSMLAYQSVKPFQRKGRAEFTYDAMNPRRLMTAFRHAAKTLPRVLAAAHESVEASGRAELAGQYAPRRSEKILDRVFRARRLFQKLLAVDAGCVGQLVKIGNHARGVQELLDKAPETASRGAFTFGNEISKHLRVHLRRLSRAGRYTPLASLVLLEATAGMAAHFGIDAPVEAVLRLNPLSNSDGEVVATARTTGPRPYIWL